MKLLTFILALLGLTATALCIAVPRAILLDCTEVNDDTTSCTSGNVLGNNIFKCIDFRWNYVEMCNDPTHCVDGACVATFESQDRDNNVDDDNDNHHLLPLTTRENVIAEACRENELKCLAQNGQGKDGAVYKCTNGMWRIIQDCNSYERCVSKPTPHCAW